MTRASGLIALLIASAGSAVRAQSPADRVAELRERGAYDEAIAIAREAGLQNLLGETLLLRGEVDAADRAFTSAVRQRQPDSLTARLNLAILQYDRGARDAARREFDTFIDVYNRGPRLSAPELLAVGIAVQYLSADNPDLARDALRAYDEAIAADPNNIDARLRIGDLFLSRYNGTEARAAFEEVLRLAEDHPRALLGLARTARFEGSRRAMESVRQALEHNPNLVAARVFLAELFLELDEYRNAEEELDRALAVNPHAADALSVRAALAFLRGDGDGFHAAERHVLERYPANAGLYATLAEVSARNRRYREAAGFARRAIELDSSSWKGHALLGINQLRLGAMESGRVHLERAFAGDPFDVWTKNTLDLLDTLDRYPGHESPRFRFAIDADESELLALYIDDLAEAAYDSLSARYGYAPPTPIRVEVFPNHADFSVRTVGLVGLGALGVSFGPVIAMDSPSARRAGDFNWGSTLWHEIAHTFHLGMTDHRVPRWFTEGLAVYEERRARPGWGDDASPAFLAAYKQGRLLSLKDLNDGFVRPAFPEQIGFSYYQASLVLEFIEERYGFAALRAMLDGFRAGAATADIVRNVLDGDMDQIDRTYDRWFREEFAGPLAAIVPADSGTSPDRMADRARRDPGNFLAQLAMGHRLVGEGLLDDAVPFLERAKQLFPAHADVESAYWLLARIHAQRGDARRAIRELTRMTAINERAYEALLMLADLRLSVGDTLGAAGALNRSMYVSPFDDARHRLLAELSEALGRHEVAVRERRAVLALRPVDRADAWYRLARAQVNAADPGGARRSVLRALELAPGFAEAQELLLELHGN